MPSALHEAIVELFRHRPVLAAEFLQGTLSVPLPPFSEARIESATFTDLAPPEYRADLVVLLADEAPILGIIIEVQLHVDGKKRYSWPHYATSLRARLSCPTCVLVYTVDADVARWAAAPVSGGPGWTFTPIVIGPEMIPVVDGIEQAAARPELAVLSAMAHGKRLPPAQAALLARTARGAAAEKLGDLWMLYYDLMLDALSEAARKELEAMDLKTYEFKSDFARKYLAEGEAKGEAKGKAEGRLEGEALAILRVLEARGVAVDETARQRILACSDQAKLDQWINRAVVATTAADVVGDDS